MELFACPHEGAVWTACVSGDGSILISGDRNGCVEIWDVPRRVLLGRLPEAHKLDVYGLSISPDGSEFVSGSRDKSIKLWDTHSCSLLRSFSGPSPISALTVNWAAQRMASGSTDATVKLWDMTKKGPPIKTMLDHQDGVVCVAFTLDGAQLLSGSCDRSIDIWDTKDGSLQAKLVGHLASVTGIATSQSTNALIVSCSIDHSIRFWDLETRSTTKVLDFGRRLLSVHLARGDRAVICGGDDGTVREWRRTNPRFLNEMQAHSAAVFSLSMSNDGRYMVTGSADASVKIWMSWATLSQVRGWAGILTVLTLARPSCELF
eukprot:c20005_g1_i3.p1 GENE.c20005_g1_i3~~c20005_g1_i3.p1  ORF type:complete len:319 (-),score=29.11 c20005_g1_i3:534-1490(-)